MGGSHDTGAGRRAFIASGWAPSRPSRRTTGFFHAPFPATGYVTEAGAG